MLMPTTQPQTQVAPHMTRGGSPNRTLRCEHQRRTPRVEGTPRIVILLWGDEVLVPRGPACAGQPTRPCQHAEGVAARHAQEAGLPLSGLNRAPQLLYLALVCCSGCCVAGRSCVAGCSLALALGPGVRSCD